MGEVMQRANNHVAVFSWWHRIRRPARFRGVEKGWARKIALLEEKKTGPFRCVVETILGGGLRIRAESETDEWSSSTWRRFLPLFFYLKC